VPVLGRERRRARLLQDVAVVATEDLAVLAEDGRLFDLRVGLE